MQYVEINTTILGEGICEALIQTEKENEMDEMNIINITKEISDEMIEDILCSAFEGGITYWANNVSCEDNKDMKEVGGWKHEYLTKTRKRDAVMYIHTMEGGKVKITKSLIIEALQQMDDPE